MSTNSAAPSARDHLRAVGVLALYLFVLVLGTPGLDMIGANALQKPADVTKVKDRVGTFGLTLARGVVAFNREVRLPLTAKMNVLQRPFRISQNWSLYRDGPGKYWRLEVVVDGVLRHRSLDEDYDWLATRIRNRKLRAMMEATVQEEYAANAKGFVRYLGEMAERDFPGSKQIEVRALRGDFPGTSLTLHHQYVAEAPDWEVR